MKYFVKPYEASEPFNDFLRYVQSQELDGDMLSNVKYAQTRMSCAYNCLWYSTDHSQRMTIFVGNIPHFSKTLTTTSPGVELRWARNPMPSTCGLAIREVRLQCIETIMKIYIVR